ncbi:hypothetical protein FB157_10786 [Streptomyces sp. BK340]|nr:hypothetical protein FB157_10786 [Streptomyces sp. BK340]
MPQTTRIKPYFELRIGGFRVTSDRIPVRVVTLLSSVVTGAAAFLWRR